MSNGVIAVEKTSNSKVGPISVTMASQESCPSSCSFKGSGCYAESGMQAMWTRKLNKSTSNEIELANEEAEAIGKLSGKRTLRLHVVGDCRSDESAGIVSKAADLYTNKHGSTVFGYTHAFRDVRRSSWGSVSIIASCESNVDAALAINRGYAPAMVVREFKSEKAYVEDGMKFIPCPEMTGKTENCTTCKLCWDDKRLLANKSVIVFKTHSQGKKKIDAALVQIGA